MRYVEAGGARLSVIGLGTWQFGSREWGYGSQYAESEAGRILERALELGINLVDTAEIYAFGRSERIVGRTIAGRRNEAFVATKVFPVLPLAPVVAQRGRASAVRLGLERIDLYQVHWPNPVVPIGTTMDGMRILQQEGVILHVGVSNFGLARWRQAEASLGGPVLSNQVQYSLVSRQPEEELLGYAASQDRVVIAYSPLAQGFLSARYRAGSAPPGGMRATHPLFQEAALQSGEELLSALERVAKAHEARPSQVALAWVISHPNVVAIPGASSVSQLEANAEAADLELAADERAELDEVSSRFHAPSGPGAMAMSVLRSARRRLPV
jgi:aryl-alcohol dehydrogenase-like predicted oxidoreductase